MANIFLLIAALLLGIAVLLYAVPRLRILNFVNYGAAASATRINRYAAVRLLLPVVVSAGSAYIAAMRPELTVPLVFPVMISILAAVIWIAAGLTRLQT